MVKLTGASFINIYILKVLIVIIIYCLEQCKGTSYLLERLGLWQKSENEAQNIYFNNNGTSS